MSFEQNVSRCLGLVILHQACTSAGQVDVARDHDVGAVSARVEPVALIDNLTWQEYAASDDPLAAHQPAEIDCGPAGYYVEPVWEPAVLELDTAYCNYALLETSAQAAVAQGKLITFELRHYDLRAPETAEAHVAILFNDDLEWETHIPIPSKAAVTKFEWPAAHRLEQGDRIRLHLHNHGQNTWVIARLDVDASARR